MSETESVTIDGERFEVKETEFKVLNDFHGFSEGVFIRVEDIYKGANGEYIIVFVSTGIGPDEIDIPAESVTEEIGESLVRKGWKEEYI